MTGQGSAGPAAQVGTGTGVIAVLAVLVVLLVAGLVCRRLYRGRR